MYYIKLDGDIVEKEAKEFLFLPNEQRVLAYLEKLQDWIDIEDDRILVYKLEEIDNNINAELVWGFWGWHYEWEKGFEQGYFFDENEHAYFINWKYE